MYPTEPMWYSERRKISDHVFLLKMLTDHEFTRPPIDQALAVERESI